MKMPSLPTFRPASLLLLTAASLLTACATEGVQQRVERRDDWIEQMGENAEIRRDARDARYDRQFDRLMD
ncbi:MAG: hypothetical protein JNK37_13100 [Verrucomicrobiales bacterium]|nr:hypothetical protein [Verrucomicrobiales bacterium]